MSFLPQNPVMQDDATVLEQVFLHFPAEFRALNEYEAKSMLNRLGLPDFEQKVGTLSGGQRKRVALAAALLSPADVLIWTSPPTIWTVRWWLAGGLAPPLQGRADHGDPRPLFSGAGGQPYHGAEPGKAVPLRGQLLQVSGAEEQRAEMAEASERKRQSILRVGREWIMQGCRARSTKSKERIARYEGPVGRDAPETDDTVQLAAASSRLGKKDH